jgi:hypothetical protein
LNRAKVAAEMLCAHQRLELPASEHEHKCEETTSADQSLTNSAGEWLVDARILTAEYQQQHLVLDLPPLAVLALPRTSLRHRLAVLDIRPL